MAFDSFYDAYLVCPLNWGLGHATRCIPIIEKLLSENKRVVIASDGAALDLLKHEFPQLAAYELPSYDVKYTADKNLMSSLMMQIPKFAIARYKENSVIEDLVLKERVGFIISDNRYGCWHLECKNYILAHHLKPIMTGGFNYFGWLVEILMLSLLSDFNEIWIPDDEQINLSGELSKLKIEDKKYIGILSRMKKKEEKASYAFDLIFILSGPEPQRSLLEDKIKSQMDSIKHLKCLLIRGVVGEIKEEKINDNFKIINWLDKEFLEDAISNSKYIICRSGYSSIMDLAVMGKKAMLIPTPGQSEQEYLAEKLKQEKKFYSCSQDDINLAKDIIEIEKFTGIQPVMESSNLEIFDKIFKIQESTI